MPLLTRHRLPLVVLAVIFLIPIGTSSLRGLTHILTCGDEVGTSVSITSGMTPDEPPIVLSSVALEAGDDPRICGALLVDLAVGDWRADTGAVELVVRVTNASELDWRGTMQLQVGGNSIPIAIGRVAADSTAEATAWVRGDEDQLEIDGTLLIGP